MTDPATLETVRLGIIVGNLLLCGYHIIEMLRHGSDYPTIHLFFPMVIGADVSLGILNVALGNHGRALIDFAFALMWYLLMCKRFGPPGFLRDLSGFVSKHRG